MSVKGTLKHQRLKIYQDILNILENSNERYICYIAEAYHGIYLISEKLPEFYLFKPDPSEDEFIGSSWFDESSPKGEKWLDKETLSFGKKHRAMVLELCIAMCEN